jgi:Ca-activated chloride channel family protein
MARHRAQSQNPFSTYQGTSSKAPKPRRRIAGRQTKVAPWIIISSVAAVLIAGVGVSMAVLASPDCGGSPVTLTVVASPDHGDVLANAAAKWQSGHPKVNGRCVQVNVERKDSSQAAVALGPSWDPREDGPRPDVWSPESTAWLRLAQLRPDGAGLLPAQAPAVARSPLVVAMPEPMGRALGWPDAQPSWRDLIALSGSSWGSTSVKGGSGQSLITKPTAGWGPFVWGMTDPARSTAGLSAALAMINFDNDDTLSNDEYENGLRLARSIGQNNYLESTNDLISALQDKDKAGQDAVLHTMSAFPAFERDVVDYNATNPKVRLVALYPPPGGPDADHPWAVLKASWVTADKRAAAEKLYDYLTGEQGRAQYADAGFRDKDRDPLPTLTQDRGVMPKPATESTTVQNPGIVAKVVAAWVGLRQKGNTLALVDVSGSMADKLGTDPNAPSKLDTVKAAIGATLPLFSSDSKLGLWAFNDTVNQLDGLNPLNQPVGGGNSQMDKLRNDIGGLHAGGSTALNQVIIDSYRYMEDHYEPGHLNVVVLLTDGAETNTATNTMPKDQLINQLKAVRAQNPNKPVSLMLVAFGDGVQGDITDLQDVAATAGGRVFFAKDPTDLKQVYLSALIGSASQPAQ